MMELPLDGGEIIKNVINVLYIAKDENGFHFAISDGNKIELSEDGIWLINGAKGIAIDSP